MTNDDLFTTINQEFEIFEGSDPMNWKPDLCYVAPRVLEDLDPEKDYTGRTIVHNKDGKVTYEQR